MIPEFNADRLSCITPNGVVTAVQAAGAVADHARCSPGRDALALSLSPTTVVGGNASTGTVTLSAAAPAGGAVVTLSDNSTVATVPANVTVTAGATSSVTANTSVSISGTYGSTTRSATLTVTPPAANVTVTVTATGRSGERVMSNPASINVLVDSIQSASFATNTSITLSATNNRDVIWSGA